MSIFKLIKNEFIKIFKRSKTWIVFALFIGFVSLTIFGTWKGAKDAEYYYSPEYQIQMSKDNIAYWEQELKTAKEENNTEWVNISEDNLRYYKENLNIHEELLASGLEDDRWKEDLAANITTYKEEIKEYEQKGINDSNKIEYSNAKLQLEILTQLQEKGLKPLENWEYTNINFLSNISLFFGIGLLVAGIAVFMSDMVSGEATPPTLKFLLVQPVSRAKILFSKYIVSIITVLLLILIPQGLGLAFIDSTSDIQVNDRLVTVHQEYEKKFDPEVNEMVLTPIADTAKNITFKEFKVETIIYQSLFIITATTVVFMFSTIFKSSMISMATSVILTIFMSIGVQIIGPLKKISHLLFTTYADTNNLIVSRSALIVNNEKVNLETSLICMGVTMLIAYIVSHINFTKKDMLI